MAGVVEVGHCRSNGCCGCRRRGATAGRRRRTAYTVLGAGYAALAAAMFVGAAVRRREVERALDRGGFADVSDNAALALTLVATVLALGTLAVIVAQP